MAEAQISGPGHVLAAVVDGEVVEECLVPAFRGAGERLDEQPVGPLPQVRRGDLLIDHELDLPLPVVVADMVVVQLDHRVVGWGLSVQGNPQPGVVLLLSKNWGGQLSGKDRRTGSVDIETADGTPPPEPVVADYVRGVREHLEPQVFLEVGGGPVELGDRVPGIRLRGLRLEPPSRLPSPGKPVEVFAAVYALEILSPFLRGLVAAEAAGKQQVVALVEGAVLLPKDPQRLFAAEVEKPQGAGVDLPGVDGPRREPAAVDAEDAVVSDPHLDPREGRVVPVAGAVETGALGRRPGGHSRRRIEEGAVQGGGSGTVRGRLETAAPGKTDRYPQVGADREPLQPGVVRDRKQPQAVRVDAAQDAEVLGFDQTGRAAGFSGRRGRRQEDSFEFLEPGLDNLELYAGPGRSGDQVGGERQHHPRGRG